MSISMKDLKSRTAVAPPRFLIYGPPGLGKTTLALEFPAPVVLDIERGLPSDTEVDHFSDLDTFEGAMEAIGALYTEDHQFRTVIVDTLDRLEPMVWNKVCRDNNLSSIEEAGYGKGYVLADALWRDFLDGLAALRRDRGVAVVMIAHSVVTTFDDPARASYSRFDIRLHKRALAMVQDEVDAILFVNQDATLKQNDPKAKGGAGARVHAEGGGTRWVYCEGRPAFVAKKRAGINLPERFMYTKGAGYAEIAKALPGAAPKADAPKKSAKQAEKEAA